MRSDLVLGILLGLASSAHGQVHLNPQGRGQALIFPYYTVNDGWSTLLSIVNTRSAARGFRVRIREGRVGQEVLEFNVYLGARDTWTGAIYDPDGNDAGPPALGSRDASCTVPAITDSLVLPIDGSGQRYVTFRTFTLDDGRTAADDFVSFDEDMREGFVEIVEMATLTGEHAAIADAGGAGCGALNDSIVAGAWSEDLSVDTALPEGGLLGGFTLVQARRAQAMSGRAVAIDGLLQDIVHTIPGTPAPSVSTGHFMDSGATSSLASVAGSTVMTQWETTLDAVQAVLMRQALYNEFVTDGGVATQWVVTLPTRPGTLLPDRPLAPFAQGYGESAPGQACEMAFSGSATVSALPAAIYDRNGDQQSTGRICFPVDPNCFEQRLCRAVSHFGFNGTGVFASPALDDVSTATNAGEFASGWVDLSLTTRGAATNLDDNPNADGHVYQGLPAIGAAALALSTDDIVDGVLANFAAMTPHGGEPDVRVEARSRSTTASPR